MKLPSQMDITMNLLVVAALKYLASPFNSLIGIFRQDRSKFLPLTVLLLILIITSRISMSLTPPRISIGNGRGFRRSRSESSLPSPPGTPTKHRPRLPSIADEGDSSYNWKKGVMDSLQISSPSLSALIKQSPRKSPRKDIASASWPLRDAHVLPATLNVAPAEEHRPVPWCARPSEDTLIGSRTKPSFDRAYPRKPSTASSSVHPHFFGRPLRGVNRTSGSSVHLYNMGISHHLRSTSSFTTGGLRTQPVTTVSTAVPTRMHTPTRRNRQISNSGFATEDVPESWGKVIEHKKDGASSTYSTRPNSARTSQCDISRRPSRRTEHHLESQETANSDDITPLPSDLTSKAQEKMTSITPMMLPKNISISNLSDRSTKSSKVSRFKENFQSSDVKKSRKRTSIVDLFNKTLRRKSASLDSFDGSVDEPRRLQRATALLEQSDAAGLMAKAIRNKHKEKSELFLKGNKDAAQHAIFRQRSSSFCRPRGNSLSEEKGGVLSRAHPLRDPHRRSTSDTFLRPEFAATSYFPDQPDPIQRASSTGNLSPQFKTSLFAGADSLFVPGFRPGSPGRTLSVSICPTTTDSGDSASTHIRRPSFQLNDIPVVLETPTASIVPEWPAIESASSIEHGKIDLDDPDLDLGPWSRYPSHTREARAGSAGPRDDVKTRDFAYDINHNNIVIDSSDNEIAGIEQAKKRGKKKKSSTLPKSRSMGFGKGFIRNYSNMFRSTSAEWLTHGKGHRSSISAGGTLEHPELETLPPVFAPMPIIHDNEEDAALKVPGKDEVEMKQFQHRRMDHGHSFVETTKAGPSRMDGSGDAMDGIASTTGGSPDPGSPNLVGLDTLASYRSNTSSDALSWSRHYESCVYLPPGTSHSTASHRVDFIQDSQFSMVQSTGGSSAGSDVPMLIDRMLASQPTSSANSPLPSPLTSPFLAPVTTHEMDAVAAKARRAHAKSVSSVASIRASSMDLLKTLREAEDRERMKVLEMLTRGRASGESSRKVSGEEVRSLEMEEREPFVREAEIQGTLGQAWKGLREAGMAVEAV